ncbi:MAG: TIGR02147 family protein [Fibrobacterota bacterium]|nr:TIGR02147 family protein [Fibrobacterota bacterium]QQS03419.1 MAG: TIGR02147 family protein [Fibrobacterota bacterium]
MPDLFTYLEYRDFLKDAYEERRKLQPYFSYRFIGNKVGMDSSYLTRLLQKKLHLGDDLVDRMAHAFGLHDESLEYFRNLVSFNKSKNDAQARVFHDQLMRLRGVGYRIVREDQEDYFTNWIHAALRSLLDYHPFDGDFEALGAALFPPVSGEEAKQSVYLLERLGMARRTESGYEILDHHLHSGDNWRNDAIKTFQKSTMDLAARSLDEIPPSLRDISTMTMNIDTETLGDLKVMVREFQENVAKLVESAPTSDRVYQLNIQLFPLSRIVEDPS